MIGLAWAIAQWKGHPLPPIAQLIALAISALAAALASNWLNEHFDAQSGLDTHTQQTPFSGGSKTLIEHPQHRELVKWAGLLALSVSVWSGLYLVAEVSIALLVLGVLGAALVLGYTPIINRFPLLCLLAPGIGYGVVIYLGSYWVFSQMAMDAGVLVMPIPILLVSALLLMNQLPDAEVDARFGRRHWAIVFGQVSAIRLVLQLHLMAFGWLGLLMVTQQLPIGAGLGLLPAVASLALWQEIHKMNPTSAIPTHRALAMNVGIVLITPVLLSIGLSV
jgi:1,4-dihydroxy-2-naphthoate octaprenyltransferase